MTAKVVSSLLILALICAVGNAKFSLKKHAKQEPEKEETTAAKVETEAPTAQSESAQWTECSRTCGKGIQTDKATGAERACMIQDCPPPHWGPWTRCPKTCGTEGTRTRECIDATDEAQCEGASFDVCILPDCPPESSNEANTAVVTTDNNADATAAVADADAKPAIECHAGTWIAITACSSTCGNGVQEFKLFNEDGSDAECNETRKVEQCNSRACPVDCVMSEWQYVDECSVTCGHGQQRWTREVKIKNDHGGAGCGPLVEYRPCNKQNCYRDAEVSDWERCSKCSVSCGNGIQKWCRNITSHEEHGGRPPPKLEEERTCNLGDCPVDCEEGPWFSEQPCPVTCGQEGTRLFKREILRKPNAAGRQCGPVEETRPCNRKTCPTDCEYGDWSPATDCSKPCGTGLRNFTRAVRQESSGGGRPCEHLTEQHECNLDDCALDCATSAWKPHGTCNVECGGGTIMLTREIEHQPNEYGRACPYGTEYRPCNTHPCAAL